MRVCYDPLAQTHAGNLGTIWALNLFYKNTVIFQGLGLTLFDIPKDVVFAEILVFSNIFGFLAVNWVPEWAKTVNVQRVPFEPNQIKIFKNFPTNVFFLLGYLWSKFQQDQTMSGGIRAKKRLKGAISWMLNQCKKL